MRKIDDSDEGQFIGEHIIGEMRQGAITGHDPIGFLRFCSISELGRTQQFHRQHVSGLEAVLEDTTEGFVERHSFAIRGT